MIQKVVLSNIISWLYFNLNSDHLPMQFIFSQKITRIFHGNLLFGGTRGIFILGIFRP